MSPIGDPDVIAGRVEGDELVDLTMDVCTFSLKVGPVDDQAYRVIWQFDRLDVATAAWRAYPAEPVGWRRKTEVGKPVERRPA